METFFALLALCVGKSPVTVEFPSQRPVTRSFDVFFDLDRLNGWVNTREAGDLRRDRADCDVAVMEQFPHKGPVMRKVFSRHGVIMLNHYIHLNRRNRSCCLNISSSISRKSELFPFCFGTIITSCYAYRMGTVQWKTHSTPSSPYHKVVPKLLFEKQSKTENTQSNNVL